MVDLKWDYTLAEGQRSNPVVYIELLDLPDTVPYPDDATLAALFQSKGKQIKTWGRAEGAMRGDATAGDPHWIGCKKFHSLHYDPGYPRYSSQLKIRVDNVAIRGMDKVETLLVRGTFYILDAHSPHQLVPKEKGLAWSVGASMDSHEIEDPNQSIPVLVDFATHHSFLTGEPL